MARFLGKREHEHDPRTLLLNHYFTHALPAAPPSCDWGKYVTTAWGMMLNDQIGDCAIAGPAHRIMLATASAGEIVVPTDDQVLAGYEAVSGYKPNPDGTIGTNDTDTGCQLLDVMKFWKNTGIAGHKIDAFVEVNACQIEELQTAIDLFGGVVVGFALPAAAQGMGNHWQAPTRQRPWFWPFGCGQDAVADDLQGEWAPGSWGGHCVILVAYDQTAKTFTAISWGEEITVDNGFVTDYLDEAFAVVSDDILASNGKDVQGLDKAALLADLSAL